jgi:hypothetical protein
LLAVKLSAISFFKRLLQVLQQFGKYYGGADIANPNAEAQR